MDEQTDAGLWQRVISGETDAFAVIHARHVDRVYRHCFARLGNRQDAEDAANQTFLDAWRRRARVQVGDHGVLPWLLAIASNVARNSGRTRRRQHGLLNRIRGAGGTHDPAVELDARLDATRHTELLRSALARLRPTSQDVVGLCAIEGLSYEEAACALGVPVGTVRSRLSRAKAQLRTILAAEGITEQDTGGVHDA